MTLTDEALRLHLGCGRERLDGWLNIDTASSDATDLICDLDGPGLLEEFGPDCVDESVAIHVLEHLHRPLEFMQALWTITKPGGIARFETPYGTSDDAWEDPTHTRPYFLGSWGYFGQPHHWRANYGYSADWQVRAVELHVNAEQWRQHTDTQVLNFVQSTRNVVSVMRCELEAVKPARPALRELQEALPLSIVRVEPC